MTEDESKRDSEARATAHALIQGYLGPDHKVIDIPSFYSALVQALKAAPCGWLHGFRSVWHAI